MARSKRGSTRRSRHLSAVVSTATVVVVVMAGCSGDDESDQATPATSETDASPATTIPVDSSTTDPSRSSTVPPTPPSTEPTPTPAELTVPVYAGNRNSTGWFMIGSWDGSGWREGPTPVVDPVDEDVDPAEFIPETGVAITVTDLAGRTDTATTGAAGACFSVSGPVLEPPLHSTPELPTYDSLALPAPPWPLKPRAVDHRTGADERFRAAAISALDGENVDPNVGQLVQSVRADLDGDGDVEEFVVYEYLDDVVRADGDPRSFVPGVAGEFSVVALADSDRETASSVIDAVVPLDDPRPFMGQFRIIDVADLNGDGRMELVVGSWYYEGAGVHIFEYVAGDRSEDGAEVTNLAIANVCGY